MYRLNAAGKADLGFLSGVGGIDEEVDLLVLLLPVEIENLAVVDDHVRFDEI